MAKVLQFRRDTTSGLSTVTGAEGELFVDLTKDTLVVMDGTTAGGQPLQKEIVASTNITSGNLNVTGVSTFAGITTVTGETLFAKQISVSGVTTVSSLYVTSPFILNPTSIDANYTVPANYNAMTVGPSIVVSSEVVVTVQSGGKWSVVP